MRVDSAGQWRFRAHAIRTLTSWWLIAAIVVWGLNDHLGKFVWPGLVTGKVSDFAGLFALPLLLASATVLVVRPATERGDRTIGVASVAAVAMAFSSVKASPAVAAVVSSGWSLVVPTHIWSDRTDLVALVVLPFTLAAWGPRPVTRSGSTVRECLGSLPRALLSVVVLVVGAGVTTATSCVDPGALESVFLGEDGRIYAVGDSTGGAWSSDGGRLWTIEDELEPPAMSPEQQVVPPTTIVEQPGATSDPTFYELCSETTCWRAVIGDEIVERDLASGAQRRIEATGSSPCTMTQPVGAMTLISERGHDVLIATNGDQGVIRIEAGSEPMYLDFALPRPLTLGEIAVRTILVVVIAVVLLIAARRWVKRRQRADTPLFTVQATGTRGTGEDAAVRADAGASPQTRVVIGVVVIAIVLVVLVVVSSLL